MLCQCCGKPKDNIAPRKSSILSDTNLLACDTCREKKFEPRHLIVIVGRSKGAARVREQIVKHLYVGEEITAAELTP